MRKIFSVSEINRYVKRMFEQDDLLHGVLVRGEVSNCKYHSSGHIYFTLKDASGTLSCVMFAGRRRGLSFRMQEGDQVIVSGEVDVYERSGSYQLYANRIIQDGAGILNAKYEELKRRLEESGMFDEMYKKPVPRYIKTLGVVTAPTGAAVQDIINISLRRDPYLQIILYPAIVQGQEAAASICEGIRRLDEYGVDVIIIGRGGGSLEDLWAFNEEPVAEAVFACSTPIISAVGHETDTVITDYVADLRAPTPSAAAELRPEPLFGQAYRGNGRSDQGASEKYGESQERTRASVSFVQDPRQKDVYGAVRGETGASYGEKDPGLQTESGPQGAPSEQDGQETFGSSEQHAGLCRQTGAALAACETVRRLWLYQHPGRKSGAECGIGKARRSFEHTA